MRVEPSKDLASNKVRELLKQVVALIGVVQQRAEASRCQEEDSHR